MMKSIYFSLFLCLIILFVSCDSESGGTIVGKWQHVDEPEVITQFLEDGTLIVSDVSEQYVGTYKFLDKEKVQVDVPGGGFDGEDISVVIEVKVKGDELTITDVDGKATEHRRVK